MAKGTVQAGKPSLRERAKSAIGIAAKSKAARIAMRGAGVAAAVAKKHPVVAGVAIAAAAVGIGALAMKARKGKQQDKQAVGSRKRVNYGNIKAARRATRRLGGAVRMLRDIEKMTQHAVPVRKSKSRSSGVITASEARRALAS